MDWNKNKIRNHIKVAGLLNEIKDNAFSYIKENHNISEYKIQQFILKQFKQDKLKTYEYPIVAFNENSAIPHYFPSKNSKKLDFNSLILIDIWAKLNQKNSPFADITWVAYYGNEIPKEILQVFNIIIRARNACIDFIKLQLRLGNTPIGKEIDKVARSVITQAGYEKNILHRTGHCIGYTSPHGVRRNINSKNDTPLLKNLGYTIEPGIYLKNKFGIRSEIDFFINKNMKLIITTNIQKKMIKI